MKLKYGIRWLVALAAFLFVVSSPLAVRAEGKSIKVLAVGNSHASCSTEYLYDVLKQCGYSNILVASCHKGGQDLVYNYDSARNNTADHIFRYTRNGSWTIKKNASVQHALKYAAWDYVIFQHKLVSQARPKTYKTSEDKNYASLMADLARKLVPNKKVKIGWNLLWAFHGHSSKEMKQYFDNDPELLYSSSVDTVKQYVYNTGKYDFMVYSGPTVENLYYNSYLKKHLLLPYYNSSNKLNPGKGIHLGGTIGSYTAAMCFAKGIGADVSQVKQFNPKKKHTEYQKLSPLHLKCIQNAMKEAWAHPWRKNWNDSSGSTPMQPAYDEPTLTLQRKNGSATLTWSKVSGAMTYRLYNRKPGAASWTKVKEGIFNTYTWTPPKKSTYEWKVTVKGDGILKDISSAIVTVTNK